MPQDAAIHSFHSMSYGRSIASATASTQFDLVFPFQFPVFSPFLRVIQWLLMSSSLAFHHFYPSLYLTSSNTFQKAIPAQDVTSLPSLFLLHVGYSCHLCMTTLTEGFPCFELSCKANARVKPAKTGHGPHSS
jgi:hypothetical protein